MDERTEVLYRSMLDLEEGKPLPAKLVRTHEKLLELRNKVLWGPFPTDVLPLIILASGVLKEDKRG